MCAAVDSPARFCFAASKADKHGCACPPRSMLGVFLSVSPQREAGPGAIYLPPLNENRQAFCSFPHSQKSRLFSCQAKRGHKAPPPFALPDAPAGITHYTLQARSCAKGRLSPPLESPCFAVMEPPPQTAKHKQPCSVRHPPGRQNTAVCSPHGGESVSPFLRKRPDAKQHNAFFVLCCLGVAFHGNI